MIPISFEISSSTNFIENDKLNNLFDAVTSLKMNLNSMPFSGSQYCSVYDSSYLSLIKDCNGKPVFENSLNFILKSMHENYSWGNQEILSDSLLSTLSSIYVLQQSHIADSPEVQNKINRAMEFIYDKYPLISRETYFTAGFEFLIPNLVQKAGLDLDNHPVTKTLQSYQKKKLSMLPLEIIETQKTPMLFALESLDDFGITTNLDHFIERNGSIATSPSTTAWYINHNKNSDKLPEMVTYLSSVYNANEGSVPSFADYSLMNIPFVLYPLLKASIILPKTYNMLRYVLQKWTSKGVGHSSFFPLTDADDTALSLLLLNKFNILEDEDKRYNSIKYYYKENYFVTYPWEIGASNMVNLHVLDLYLESSHKEPNRYTIIDHLISFINKQITTSKGIGGDKYHYSPYCQNAHAVLALGKYYPDISRKLIDWFLSNQDEKGLWGSHGSNVEETAYAIMSLCYYHIYSEKIDLNILYNAIEYLSNNSTRYPDLWLSKVAYTPIETVKAHILAALELYHQAVA